MTEPVVVDYDELASPAEPKARHRRIERDESGLALVWMSMFLMVLVGFAALAIDLGTVKSRLSRARAALRERLAEVHRE